jgi:hypothetical protein
MCKKHWIINNYQINQVKFKVLQMKRTINKQIKIIIRIKKDQRK